MINNSQRPMQPTEPRKKRLRVWVSGCSADGEEEVVFKMTKKQRANFERLETQVKEKKLRDYHAHLMGMGDSEDWLRWMTEFSAHECLSQEFYVTAVDFSDLEGAHKREERIQRRKEAIIGCLGASSDASSPSICAECLFGSQPRSLSQIQIETLANSLRTNSELREILLEGSEQGKAIPEGIEYTREVVISRANLKASLLLTSNLWDFSFRAQASFVHAATFSEMILQHPDLKEFLIFNARKQRFQIINGLPLRALLSIASDSGPLMNVLRNAFTIAEEEKTTFTPHFYPRRFALKDSLYEQYLSVLDRLLDHVLDNYRQSGVKYAELSVGHNDLILRPWVFNHLFEKCRNSTPEIWFLAGLPRTEVRLKFDGVWRKPNDPIEAADYLEKNGKLVFKTVFDPHKSRKVYAASIDSLKRMTTAFAYDQERCNSTLIQYVVGLDWFGDEFGFPYCPFWMEPFLRFNDERMKTGPQKPGGDAEAPPHREFGLRPHMGEVSKEMYKGRETAFDFHKRVVKEFLLKLPKVQNREGYHSPLRIGHGVLCMDRSFTNELGAAFPQTIELNLTSNAQLLEGISLENHPASTIADYQGFAFCTDNDGVFRIRCGCLKAHRSVAAERCKAIQYHMPVEPAILDIGAFKKTGIRQNVPLFPEDFKPRSFTGRNQLG